MKSVFSRKTSVFLLRVVSIIQFSHKKGVFSTTYLAGHGSLLPFVQAKAASMMPRPGSRLMLLIGRYSLNLNFFLIVHWVIILVPVNFFKRFYLIWPSSTRKVSTYLPPHSLFKSPVLPLQHMCDLALPFCHFSTNVPVWNQLSVNIKIKRLYATLKSLPWSLTGCSSISDDEDEGNAKSGLERGFCTGGTLWKHPLAQRLG